MKSFYITVFIILSCDLILGDLKLPLKIINGKTVNPPHSLPYQVLLIMKGDPLYDVRFCGGALISEEWVLTSGNCTHYAKETLCEAFLGVQNMTAEEDELQFTFVKDYVTHHHFDPDSLSYNIGLVHLQTPAVLSDAVRPINLTTKSTYVSDLVGQTGTISGWGSKNSSNSEQITYVLQSATMKVLDKANCTQTNKDIDLDTHFCAKSDKGAHVYGTDFGGPLVVNGTLVGISSFWSGNETDYDLYTSVHLFLDWISEITNIPVH